MVNLSVIRNISRIKKCQSGTVITGNNSNHVLFVILKGEVGVYTNYRQPNSELIAKLGAGDLFADPALLQEKKAAYTTVAFSEAIILPIDRQGALDFIKDEPAMALEIIRELGSRASQPVMADKEPDHRQDKKPRRSAEAAPVSPQPEPDQTTVPAAAEAAAPAAAPALSADSRLTLFPEGHGQYELTLNEPESPYLMAKPHTCPICKGSFTAQMVRPSKLAVAATDADLRYRYRGVEPLYYEVLTCPHCLYSALADVFDAPDRPRQVVERELAALKKDMDIVIGPQKTTDTVFAGYYLALHCAPVSFTNHQIVMGRLLYKLSRVYQDVGDENMENTTAQKALEQFLGAYSQTTMSPAQEQQVCVTLGELYFKQNDLRNAINFFSKAKSNSSSNVLKSHADNRIYDIRAKAGEQRS